MFSTTMRYLIISFAAVALASCGETDGHKPNDPNTATVVAPSGASTACKTVAECAQFAAQYAKSASDAAAKVTGSVLPAGTIIAWYAKSGPLPIGWAICDGKSGTPDLRGKFLSGVGTFEEVSDKTFGAPTHQHAFSGTTAKPRTHPDPYHIGGNVDPPPQVTGLDHQHDFSGTTDSAPNIPPNIHIIFIMKLKDN
jgi:hypothetical protein